MGKLVGNRPLGSPRHRWKHNIKMVHLEMGWGRDWVVLAQKMYMWQALVNVVMNFRVS